MPVNSPRLFNPVADFHAQQDQNTNRWQGLAFPDIWLLLAIMCLMCIGMVMVTSASAPLAAAQGKESVHYALRQAVYYGLGLFMLVAMLRIESEKLRRRSHLIIVCCFILLIAVLIPGIGRQVNGAQRWINLGIFNLQAGEVMKLGAIIFAAAFFHRHRVSLRHSFWKISQVMMFLGVTAGLLLLEPDFGTTVVVVATVLIMLYLAGANLWYLALYGLVALLLGVAVIVIEPYRLQRITSFLKPFDFADDEGYQLVHSLIAIGRGEIEGVGLGESIFKHQFVPEAHTDFIFAIISEEFGLIGALLVMGLFALLIWRAFATAVLAHRVRKNFASLLACGIGTWLGIQSLINFGVVNGSLPTKGLTLPLISYGGSSVIITCMALGILLRIDAESRFVAKREGKI